MLATWSPVTGRSLGFSSDSYPDPYRGKTGRHTVTSHKNQPLKNSAVAIFCRIHSQKMARIKIHLPPVRIPPSPPKEAGNPKDCRPLFYSFSAVSNISKSPLFRHCLEKRAFVFNTLRMAHSQTAAGFPGAFGKRGWCDTRPPRRGRSSASPEAYTGPPAPHTAHRL